MTWEEIADLEDLKERGYKPMGNIETLKGIKSFISVYPRLCPH